MNYLYILRLTPSIDQTKLMNGKPSGPQGFDVVTERVWTISHQVFHCKCNDDGLGVWEEVSNVDIEQVIRESTANVIYNFAGADPIETGDSWTDFWRKNMER